MAISISFQGKLLHDKRVVNKMKVIVKEHLEELGFSGAWKVEPYKKTGANIDGEIFLRKVVHIGENGRSYDYALYAVCPFDRDSSWNVIVIPPANFKINDLQTAEEKLNGIIQEQEEKQEQEHEDTKLVRNQCCLAKPMLLGKSNKQSTIRIEYKNQ